MIMKWCAMGKILSCSKLMQLVGLFDFLLYMLP